MHLLHMVTATLVVSGMYAVFCQIRRAASSFLRQFAIAQLVTAIDHCQHLQLLERYAENALMQQTFWKGDSGAVNL